MRHELKSINPYFDKLYHCAFSSDIRKNDRDFQPDDQIVLKEYDPKTGLYTGRMHICDVLHVCTSHPGLKKGYCMLSLDHKEWVDGNKENIQI